MRPVGLLLLRLLFLLLKQLLGIRMFRRAVTRSYLYAGLRHTQEMVKRQDKATPSGFCTIQGVSVGNRHTTDTMHELLKTKTVEADDVLARQADFRYYQPTMFFVELFLFAIYAKRAGRFLFHFIFIFTSYELMTHDIPIDREVFSLLYFTFYFFTFKFFALFSRFHCSTK